MNFAIELLHPELVGKSYSYLYMRSAFPFKYFFPYDSRINWYGGAIRNDGKQGMYMTEAQARDWAKWVVSDVSVGPV
jgi:hypothetical protein